MKQVTFSIVGCGRIGMRHAEHISRLGQLVAACDIDERALQAFSLKFPGIRLYSSVQEMLLRETGTQVMDICTPNGLHAEHTVLALKNGYHVVCEKPMALRVSDAEWMIQEARKAKRHLFIVKQNRFNPPVAKVKEIIESGRLGKIYSAQVNCFWNRNDQYYKESPWKGSRELDGGILFTQFSHFIDLMYWFLGDVEKVAAYSKNYNHLDTIEFEDTVVALLEFKSGALATLNCTVNSYRKNMEGSITIFAENGTVKIGGQYLNVLEYQNIQDYVIKDIESYRPANDYGYYQGSMSNHDKVIENVIDVLTNNGRIATTGEEGLKSVEIIEKIYSQINPHRSSYSEREMRENVQIY